MNSMNIDDFLIRKTLLSRYNGMLQRCFNSKTKGFERYGGRKIEVCDEWVEDKNKFFEWAVNNGFSKELQLDRRNNDGNYEPSNCRWVTQTENIQNRSPFRSASKITINGEEITLRKAAERYGITYHKIRHHLSRGLSGDETMFFIDKNLSPTFDLRQGKLMYLKSVLDKHLIFFCQ